jgi:3-oxoacyl-[acyl-carrier protein] reductase
MLFKGKVALITGASSGIGHAAAIAFAREGASIAVNYLKNDAGGKSAAEAVRKVGQEALIVKADVTRAADVQEMIHETLERLGRIDILVNNAGDLVERRRLGEIDEAYWDYVMALNLKSIYLCTQAVWKHMAERGNGVIINVSSIAGRNGGGADVGVYAAAKGGVITYTKSLASELTQHGIRVNGINPGLIATPFHERYTSPELMNKIVSTIPMKRPGTPEEVADVILFLASPAARYMVGETVEVNGGKLMD